MDPDRGARYLKDAVEDATEARRRGHDAAREWRWLNTGHAPELAASVQDLIGVVENYHESVMRAAQAPPPQDRRSRRQQRRSLRRSIIAMHRAADSIETLVRFQ